MGVFLGCIVMLLCLIQSINANQAPTITQESYQVCEDTPINAIAFTIKANDNDGDTLTYELEGPNREYFEVNKDTGVVKIKAQLDREKDAYISLGVVVSDVNYRTRASLTIFILEANDNQPIFQNSIYDYKVKENTTVGTVLFTAHATDKDFGPGGSVRYSIAEVTPSDGVRLFAIAPTTGEVKLTGSLDFNKNSLYQLTINATDGGDSCYYNKTVNFNSNTAPFLITVEDVPNLDPEFINLPYDANIKEHSPLHTSVFTVSAIDPDRGINDDIIYTIKNSTAEGLFAVSRDQGVISVAGEIDRELVGEVVVLTVQAAESKLNIKGNIAKATATVRISIDDINDQKPEFYKCGDSGCVAASHFTADVDEHWSSFISINMTVKDADVNSRASLSLEGDNKDIFSVEPPVASSGTAVQLRVTNPRELDFESVQQMVLNVIAIDQGDTSFRSTATVTIKITDTNDNNPRFISDTYKLNVSEHSPDGTIIGHITAIDPDTMDQGKITYSLLPESILQYFNVMPDTGSVYVVNETLLDREVRSLYSATLRANDTDNRVGTAVLEITVTDINDQPPVFNRESYLAFVQEGAELKLKIEATDADESGSLNSQIVYAIVPSNYSDNFTIDSTTGELTSVGDLDREALDPTLKGKITLNISATDRGTPPLSSFVTVIVNVEDVNDNVPVFRAPSYTFSVKEGEKGAYVGSVFAEDFDQTTDFSRISFSIISGSFGSFIIRSYADGNGYRGDITVDPDIELDYESTRKQFTLEVEATDLEQEKAVVTVKVNVLDVNDERPMFNTTVVVEVRENTTIQGAVGKFTAFDKDGNHSLVYELESEKCKCNGSLTACSVFILDPTGEVRVKPGVTLDYEQCDQVLIEAQVVDELTEMGENSSVAAGQMVINIVDINDNAPEFIDSESVFVVVSETASKGTAVARVSATDRDTKTQIRFQVTAVQFEDISRATRRLPFEAVTTQQNGIFVGIIQTVEELDITKRGKFMVTVEATDNGGLSTSTALVIFTVDQAYRVELEFTSSLQDTEAKLNDIVRALTVATLASVEIVSIRSDSAETARATGTIIAAYFVFSNGTALTPEEVEKKLSNPDNYLTLLQLGLQGIGMSDGTGQETNTVQYILLGIVAGLVVVLLILITALTCTRTKYRRKLRAAKAMNSAAKVTSENQKSGPVVPGTNKYTMEGANPVLNLNIDTTLVLDLEEEDSDVDKVSLGSIDDSSEHDTKEALKMQEEVSSKSTEYIEPLSAALAERSPVVKSSVTRHVGFQNPAFNTTDL